MEQVEAWAAAEAQVEDKGVAAGWVATVPAQGPVANAFARNAAPEFPIRSECPATISVVPNAVQRWREPE